ncbi:MAG: hypothetical protein VZT47_09165, partial [Dialister sp.]|nr:hypothetical protein [Dialister sp.]
RRTYFFCKNRVKKIHRAVLELLKIICVHPSAGSIDFVHPGDEGFLQGPFRQLHGYSSKKRDLYH